MAFKASYAIAFFGFVQAQTIILDPGHGGRYPGSRGQKIAEKDLTLSLAKKVADILRKKHISVVLTRDSDVHLDKIHLKDLEQRAAIANNHKDPLFISLHLNWAPNKKRRGFEVYVPYKDTYQQKDYSLASAIHYELSHQLPKNFGGGTLGNLNRNDRGIRAARFNVLVKSQCPAVLVELDYLSNPTVEKELLAGSYQNQLAAALADGILRYTK